MRAQFDDLVSKNPEVFMVKDDVKNKMLEDMVLRSDAETKRTALWVQEAFDYYKRDRILGGEQRVTPTRRLSQRMRQIAHAWVLRNEPVDSFVINYNMEPAVDARNLDHVHPGNGPLRWRSSAFNLNLSIYGKITCEAL